MWQIQAKGEVESVKEVMRYGVKKTCDFGRRIFE